MYQLLINVLIIAVILFGVWWTSNPLFVMGLLLLQAMPPVFLSELDDPDDHGQPMGFTADLE